MTIAVPLGHEQYNYLWRFSDQEGTVSGDVTCGSLNGTPHTCTFAAEVPLGEAAHNVVPKISAMVPVVAAFREKHDQTANAPWPALFWTNSNSAPDFKWAVEPGMAELRSGNVARAKDWRLMLEPVIERYRFGQIWPGASSGARATPI